MSYTKEIPFRDLEIAFEYEYTSEGLQLESWIAYNGPNELAIPCRVEADFIESQILDWLDKEFSKNAVNYQEDYVASLGEKYYNNYVDDL